MQAPRYDPALYIDRWTDGYYGRCWILFAGFHIGDYVWYDQNGNGTQNSNEVGIPERTKN